MAAGWRLSSGWASTTTAPARTVHVSLFQGDGQVYGVGFAIIARFNRAPTDSHAFTEAVTVTVNDKLAGGAWLWQRSGQPGVANFPLEGLSAGRGLVYDDSLTLSIRAGAWNISTVHNATDTMTVTSDGKLLRRLPVSLGSGDHPTYHGTKVVMAKGENGPGSNRPRPQGEVRMRGSDYDLLVPWSVRVTNSGEYVHAASGNIGNIGSRNTSHGCTNLDVDDAQWFYRFALVGDVVEYPDASGPRMPSWDGWGWWNLCWSVWSQGGLLHTH